MLMARLRRRGRVADDRGTALIEATFVFPVVILIIFGIIELGYLFRSASVVNSASRSGARVASTLYPAASCAACTAADQAAALQEVRKTVEQDLAAKGGDDTPQELWIYKANSTGFPDALSDFSACATNCAKFFNWNGTNFTGASGTWPSPDACGQTIDTVGVYVRVLHTPLASSAILGTKAIGERTVMRLEPRADCTTAE